MNIGIVGAGNIGTALAVDLARNNTVKIYSSRPEMFSKTLVYRDMETGEEFNSDISLVSNRYEDVVSDADVIFLTLPTFLIKSATDGIVPYLKKKALVGCVPGAGGVDFLASRVIENGNILFGFDRVPYVSRLVKYGHIVSASKKAAYRIALLPQSEADIVAGIISKLFDRPCKVMKEFLAMGLTPTLHTSRLYDLYKNYIPGAALPDNPYFYREWRDSASYLCLSLDDELHKVCDELDKFGFNMSEVVPYTTHYESATPELLTQKLQSISSFYNIKGPVVENEKGVYILDLDSRYFTESYPYRLCIVKGLADIVSIDVPLTDEILKWYSKLTGKEYYIDGKFKGKDLVECNVPQNNTIYTIDDLKKFYGKS